MQNGRLQIGLEPFRAARLSSNSVRLLAPDRFVVVDAGGEPEILRRHFEAIASAQPVPPLPVCLVQTHAHIDHIAGLTGYGPLPDGWAYELAAHESALDILRQGDRLSSLADLTGRPLEPFHPAGWRFWPVRPKPGAGPTDPDLAIPLGEGLNLEAYCTPGHSPDSVTWRAGRILFAGDLLAATAPLVAGIPGWDRDALLASLERLERLLAAHGIEQVHVGHGRPLDPPAVTEAIARSRREAGDLARIEQVDRDRIHRTAVYADGLIEELEDLFAEMAVRIARLADKLSQIQESRTADEVRGIDRSNEVRLLLDAFDRFKQGAHARGDGLLGIATKGIETVQRISRLLAWERLDWVIEESFLRYVRTRVVDFIQRAKGLAPAGDQAPVELTGAIEAYARRLRDQPRGACPLDAATGDEAGFRRQLAYCLARTPSLASARLSLELPPGPVQARLDPVRFFDALTRLIEHQTGRGGRHIGLALRTHAGSPALELDAAGQAWAFDDARGAVWEKIMARAGAQLDFPPADLAAPLVFVFDT